MVSCGCAQASLSAAVLCLALWHASGFAFQSSLPPPPSLLRRLAACRSYRPPSFPLCGSRGPAAAAPRVAPRTSTAEDWDELELPEADAGGEEPEEEPEVDTVKRRRGRPRKTEAADSPAAPPKRKRKSKKVGQFSFLQEGEEPHPDCRAHLAIVHTGSEEDMETVAEMRALLEDQFGDVVNVYDEAFDKEPSRLFEMWLEGPNIVRLYSRQGQLDGDLDAAAKERILNTIAEEVSDNAMHTYGPF